MAGQLTEGCQVGDLIEGECWVLPPVPGIPGVITTVADPLCNGGLGIWVDGKCYTTPPTPAVTTSGYKDDFWTAGVCIPMGDLDLPFTPSPNCTATIVPVTPGVLGDVTEPGEYCNLILPEETDVWAFEACWTLPPTLGEPGVGLRSCSGSWVNGECWASPPVEGIALRTLGEEESFSMIIASDSQFNWWRHGHDPDCDSKDCIADKAKEINQNLVKAMTDILELDKWPSGLALGGGTQISAPSGVIINGDLTNYWHPWQFELYEEYYTDDLDYQIYAGLGNHDYSTNFESCSYSAEDVEYLDHNRCAKRAVWWMADQIEDEIPNIVNHHLSGEVSVLNGAGYIARFMVQYKELNGETVSENSGDFPLGFWNTVIVPAGASNIEVTIEALVGFDFSEWLPIWEVVDQYKYPLPTTKCYKAFGTIFDPDSIDWACKPVAGMPSGSHGSLAYAYDIGDVHFVQLQFKPDYERFLAEISFPALSPSFDVIPSYDWLEKDLQTATAAGKYIVINMHDAQITSIGTNLGKDDQFMKAITGTNVAAIFAGHIHQKYGKQGTIDNGVNPNIP